MGKSISGKELGKGLGQRKDGLYYARYKDNNEKWQEKCFKKLTDARNWQQEQLYLAHHAVEQRSVSDMTVDEWFCYWMDTQLTGLSPNTQRNYRERYEKNAKNILDKMRLSEVKQDWRAGPSKTKKSYRTIPLTNRAYQILQELYLGRQHRKESPELQKSLTYLDRKTGSEKTFCMRDLVFVNWRTGMPAKNSSYDARLYKLCDQAGIDRFCMHALRHTYATRAIESGMPPEILKQLLGHESIKTTMDKYVHVTDDRLFQAVAQFEKAGMQAQNSE